MKCNCGGEMEYYRGMVPDADFWQCAKCGAQVYINEKQW